MIYFDASSTTKPETEVVNVYNKIITSAWYNPSAIHTAGLFSKNLIDKATKSIIDTLGLNNKKIIYTSGATEANNMAIYGVCNNYLNENKRIITTMNEHSSVYEVYKDLEQKGFDVVYLNCKNGTIDLNELKTALTKNTILVSIMWVNNILGTINNIDEIIKIVKNNSHAKLHVDMVQGLGKIKIDFDINKIDFASITAHKIYGLKSIGMLICNNDKSLKGIFKGGHQQEGIRPGTMDSALIVSFAKTINMALSNIDNNFNKVKELYQYLLNELNSLKHIVVHTTTSPKVPHVLAISFKNVKGETAMHYLEQKDIIVGIGSACNEKEIVLERAITELTNSDLMAINMIRISISHHNTKDELDILVKAIKELERI